MSLDASSPCGEPVAVVVEVGSQIRRHVEDYFEKNDIRMVASADSPDADHIIHAACASVVLLNLNLRENRAFALCQEIKERSRIPVVMVSSTYTEVDKIVSLEMGADDCLPIDFNPRQVVARMRSVLGRRWSKVSIGKQASESGITLNRMTHEVQVGRQPPKTLSPAEYDMLNFLVENAGRILPREEIHSGVFGAESPHTFQFVDVMICRVRKKIESNHRRPKILRTIRGLGYILEADI